MSNLFINKPYHDIRVFDAHGQALPHALLAEPTHPAQDRAGPTVPALPLPTPASPSGTRMSARVELRGSGHHAVQQLQVQWDSAAPGTGGMQAAVFDLRTIQGKVRALDVDLSLPDNTPVHLHASLSKTLQQWQAVPSTGPLYRFAGAGAPQNMRLQWAQAQSVQDQFLLLQWPANAGVHIKAATARLVADAEVPPVVEADLPPGQAARDGKGLEWTLPVAARVLSVQWQLPQPLQLRTYQLQGRRASGTASAPWEPLGSVVVYHLVQGGETRRSPPLPLPAGDWRKLRLSEWPSGDTPAAESLQARMQLQPVSLAFVANGQGPYTLAVGRADTPVSAVSAATLSAAAATPAASWPLASVGETHHNPEAQAPGLATRWRNFVEDANASTSLLWLVLALAVALLVAVAVKLLRSAPAAAGAETPPQV
ncbi:MAG: DUF3999 family protein [Rhodoferax sp.]